MAGKFQAQNEQKKNNRVWLIVLLLSLLLLAGAAIWYLAAHVSLPPPLDPSDYHSVSPTSPKTPTVTQAEPLPSGETETTQPAETTTEVPLVDNPVDFDALAEVNSDVYAWLYIPMEPEKRDIDLPVLQSRPEDDDNYYLHRDIHRNYLYAGCLYTQKANHKDFSDRMTVIYGHNMLDGTMFSNLPCFQDAKFFETHEFFYIYTPGHILTYRIASAIQFDTRHLLNCFNFADDRVFESWIQSYILEPRTMIRNVREDIEVTIEDKIVVLSTCLEHGASRYLIQGVLISDELTY